MIPRDLSLFYMSYGPCRLSGTTTCFVVPSSTRHAYHASICLQLLHTSIYLVCLLRTMISFDLVMLLSSIIHLTVLLIYLNNLMFLMIRSRTQTPSISSSPKIELTQEVVTKSQVLKPNHTTHKLGGSKRFPKTPMSPRKLEVQNLRQKTLDRTQYLPEGNKFGEENVKAREIESKTGTDDVPNKTQATVANEEDMPLLWRTQSDDDYFAINTKVSKKASLKHSKQSRRRLPRAPKGTHDEELRDMEEFINEMETPVGQR
ncbi:unnamed protein product [Cylicocyclus nassatus]|uniref:Uncharacterized protein n=1 Tax=Cylicocyclus nassatus TaxID=53992 RepID=A0AA36MCR4_CYLNA|nr:unnamed protein product [Cylicocyclus nassatus]